VNVDLILSTFNQHHADYILIGGMNFFLNHEPVTTFDVDLWIADTRENHQVVHVALSELHAEVSFSPKGDDWRQVCAFDSAAWLQRSAVFCLFSPNGSIDIFRSVPGLEAGFATSRDLCPVRQTPTGVPYRSLNDELMIRCQLALPEADQKKDRLRSLGYQT
jgi:hypothetical protein